MVGALGPAVRGADRGQARQVVVVHASGLITGSMLTALTLIALGTALPQSHLALLLPAALLLLVAAQILGHGPPQSRWQVPEAWRRGMDVSMLAASYGFILGMGVFTAVVLSAFWVFVALSIAAAPTAGALGWLAYGVARAAAFVLAARQRRPELVRWMSGLRPVLVAVSGPVSGFAVLTVYSAI